MYNEKYDLANIRQENSDFVEFVTPYLSPYNKMIDLGCGTCRKVVSFAPLVKHITAIDRNEIMLKCAKENLAHSKILNVDLFLGDNLNTPFNSHEYDMCTTSLSFWSAAEVHRLLKSEGLLFIETLCPEDKFEIKEAFGKDDIGYRGYLYNRTTEETIVYLKASLSPFFDINSIKQTVTDTVLSEEGFINLLEVTPTIRNFSLERDIKTIKFLVNNGCVHFTEKRLMIMATSKKQLESDLWIPTLSKL